MNTVFIETDKLELAQGLADLDLIVLELYLRSLHIFIRYSIFRVNRGNAFVVES